MTIVRIPRSLVQQVLPLLVLHPLICSFKVMLWVCNLFVHYHTVILHIGLKTEKVPVHKMVRTDSTDPAGRLHAYVQIKPPGLPESSLTAVRYVFLLDLTMELLISKCCIVIHLGFKHGAINIKVLH